MLSFYVPKWIFGLRASSEIQVLDVADRRAHLENRHNLVPDYLYRILHFLHKTSLDDRIPYHATLSNRSSPPYLSSSPYQTPDECHDRERAQQPDDQPKRKVPRETLM
jgi:hypothetical protein